MSTEQDDGRPDRDQIEIDALFAAQQADRRRQRTRVALVTVAALAAGGVTGGIAVGVIGGEDGGTQPVAGSASPSAEQAEPGQAGGGQGESGQEGSSDEGSVGEGDPSGADQQGSGERGPDQQDTDVFPDSGSSQSSFPSPGSGQPSEGSTSIPSSPPQQEPGAGGGTGDGADDTDSPDETPPGSTTPTPASPGQPAQHVVQDGESLWKITAGVLGEGASAQQILDSWPRLYEANRHLIGDDPDLLYPGQELVIPALV